MRLVPNLGGEEGPRWRELAGEPAVRAQRRLWRLLFAADTECLDLDESAPRWPGAPVSEEPTFPWLAEAGCALAWINTEDAERAARGADLPLAGPSADIVASVHDKAFAHDVADSERMIPPALRGCIETLSPDALRAADAADAIEARLARWPEWARERFTLKPRLGGSGRGRIAGESGRLDRTRLGRGLERLAARGGAMLEPWLERTVDLSVQLHLGGDAGVTVLGSLEQFVSPSGVFLGHGGELDSRGRVFSGHAQEERLREAAALVGVAARERGYLGPCGVDAFEFRDVETDGLTLRPVVEFNARFTAGTVTVGLVRRALPELKRELGLAPGERMYFRFWLALPPEERAGAEARTADSGRLLLFDASDAPPALLFSRTAP